MNRLVKRESRDSHHIDHASTHLTFLVDNMNKFLFTSFTVLCLLSISEAAGKKPFYFNLFEEFQGSWVTMEIKISISTGAIISESVQGMYNVSKNVIPNELVISEVNLSTKDEIRKPYQMIISASSNYTASVNRFEPGAEVEIAKQFDINFKEFLINEVFVCIRDWINCSMVQGPLSKIAVISLRSLCFLEIF